MISTVAIQILLCSSHIRVFIMYNPIHLLDEKSNFTDNIHQSLSFFLHFCALFIVPLKMHIVK